MPRNEAKIEAETKAFFSGVIERFQKANFGDMHRNAGDRNALFESKERTFFSLKVLARDMQVVMALGVKSAILQKRLIDEFESVRAQYELQEQGVKADDWARIRLIETFPSLSEIRRPETIERIATRFMEFVTELRPMRDRIIAG